MEPQISAQALEVLRLLTRGVIPNSTSGRIATELLRAGFAVDTLSGLEPTEIGRRYVAAHDAALAQAPISLRDPDNA